MSDLSEYIEMKKPDALGRPASFWLSANLRRKVAATMRNAYVFAA